MEMRSGQMTEQFRRQRKMMLILPLVVVPLLAVAFHGLGGGKGIQTRSVTGSGKGLNMSLPEARFDPKKKAMNKLGLYTQAEHDSLKLLETRKQDPYYVSGGFLRPKAVDPGNGLAKGLNPDSDWRKLPAARSGVQAGSASQADALIGKLNDLKGVLSRQAAGQTAGLGSMGRSPEEMRLSGSTPALSVPGGLRLPDRGPGDPDLEKLSGMLDKILRIQHPGEDTTVHGSEPPSVAQVVGVVKEDGIGTMTSVENIPGPGKDGKVDSGEVFPGSGFMELDDASADGAGAEDNMLEAAMVRDQTLVSGESVELRLSEEAVVSGVTIPSGALMTGKTSLSGERLLVQVSAIRVGNRSVAVSLEVVDLDGVPGILERGSINRDVAKESADEAVGTLGVTSLDPGLGGQAAAAGIEAAKSLLSRKVKLVRVSIPAGYKVFLRNTKSKKS